MAFSRIISGVIMTHLLLSGHKIAFAILYIVPLRRTQKNSYTVNLDKPPQRRALKVKLGDFMRGGV